VAIQFLLQNRPLWSEDMAIGKSMVTSQLIDRIAASFKHKLFEVPVGFKWFVKGLLDSSLCYGCEESAGATFPRFDGCVWTTDKDGILMCLLAAEICARSSCDLGDLYNEITSAFGTPAYQRIDAPATMQEKAILANLTAEQLQINDIGGEKIDAVYTHALGNGAPLGGMKVVRADSWFAIRPSGTEDIYKIYGESFRGEEHLSKIMEEAQNMVNHILKERMQ
jgi:phosphoglucomutase